MRGRNEYITLGDPDDDEDDEDTATTTRSTTVRTPAPQEPELSSHRAFAHKYPRLQHVGVHSNILHSPAIASPARDPAELFLPGIGSRVNADERRERQQHIQDEVLSNLGSPQRRSNRHSPIGVGRSPGERDTLEITDPRKRWAYLLLEDATSSRNALFLSTFISVMIAASAVLTTIETMPVFHGGEAQEIWFIVETTIVAIFTIEYVFRLYAHSQTITSLWRFCFSFLGIIDCLAIVPYYFELAFHAETTYEFRFTILRLFRLFRVFRAFKYSSLIQMSIEAMIVALKMSTDALLALLFFSSIVIITFSTFIYFAERGTWDSEKHTFITPKGDPSAFDSIPSSFWFVIVTLTTTGYGDMVPATFVGKLVAFPLMICGILLIALPSIIVGRNFTVVWEAIRQFRTPPADIHAAFNSRPSSFEMNSLSSGDEEVPTRNRSEREGTGTRQSLERNRRHSEGRSSPLFDMENAKMSLLTDKVRTLQESQRELQATLQRVLSILEDGVRPTAEEERGRGRNPFGDQSASRRTSPIRSGREDE